MNSIRTRIIKIGNSQGIRIPKTLLEQSGLGEEVELEVRDETIIIRRTEKAREGWEEQFRMMAAQGDDQLLDGDAPSLTTWDEDEWEW